METDVGSGYQSILSQDTAVGLIMASGESKDAHTCICMLSVAVHIVLLDVTSYAQNCLCFSQEILAVLYPDLL